MGGRVSGILQAIAVTAVGAVLGWLIGGPIAALVLGAISLGFAVGFGRAVARGEPYRGAGGARRAVIDATWSSPNTWVGAIYYGIHRLAGNTHDPERSRGTGAIWLEKGFIPQRRDSDTGKVAAWYATTIGTVKAGSYDEVDPHEQFHVFQARLFGPLYVPLVVANYLVATVLPYWFLVPSECRRPISGVVTYFTHGVYPHVWNEWWAYQSKGP